MPLKNLMQTVTRGAKRALGTVALLSFSFVGTSTGEPNVILIIADDAGYADWGFMDGVDGSNATPSDVPTPNLDALAARGVKFSRCYVGQSCQPTRAALVTGGYQNRIGNEVVGNNYYLATDGFSPDGYPEGIPAASETIWERMKSLDYSTTAVGKWHIGQIEETMTTVGNRPEHQGVDEFFGIWHGSRTYNVGGVSNQTQRLRRTVVDSMGNVTDTNEEPNHVGEYFTETLGQFAVDYIADHYDDTDPFFIYQSFTAPHTPMNNSPDFNDPSIAGLSGIRKQYASMVLTMDKEIGRIMDRLEDPNNDGNTADSITDNTFIIFINDNGGAHAGSSSPNGADNGVLRAGKGSPYEGGIRVPMIIAGAGVLPAVHGTTYSKPVHGVDVVPTIVAAGGGSLGPSDPGIDGVNLLPFINGTDTSDPHDVLINRHRGQVGVVWGDWKLVKSGNAATNGYQLFNLATDVEELTNVAGANPSVVEKMMRDVTDFEAGFDKARYEILGNTSELTINIFDHFDFRPSTPGGGSSSDLDIIGDSTTQKGPDIVGPNSNLGNGDFETTSTPSSADPISDVSTWHHVGGAETQNFGTTQGTNGSPQSGSSGAFLVKNNLYMNSTGYVIQAADVGKPFAVNMYLGQFGSQANYGGDEVVNVGLYYVTSSPGAGTITDATVPGDLTQLGSNLALNPFILPGSSAFFNMAGGNIRTIQAGDVGNKVFLGIELSNPTGGNVFPRIDVVSLSITGGVTGGGSSSRNWSALNAWFEAGTSNQETMLFSDPFPGMIVEFATEDTFSYTANNDMIRQTNKEFMANKMLFSGSFGGASAQTATIQGNEILFTDDLAGNSPEIEVTANNTGLPEFSFIIDSDVVMYDDLTITGNGDAPVIINGVVSSFFTPRGLIKSGTSVATLNASNTYTGDTTVDGGTLSLSQAYLDNGSTVNIAAAGATLDLTFGGTDTIDALFIGGTQQAAGVYEAIGNPGSGNEISQITGTGTLTVLNGPAGYALWAATNAPGQSFDADHDDDDVANGIEYFMGESGSGFTEMPSPDSSGVITWPMGATYTGVYGTDYVVETSTTLQDGSWTEVLVGDVTINPGTDISFALTPGLDELFVRLSVSEN